VRCSETGSTYKETLGGCQVLEDIRRRQDGMMIRDDRQDKTWCLPRLVILFSHISDKKKETRKIKRILLTVPQREG